MTGLCRSTIIETVLSHIRVHSLVSHQPNIHLPSADAHKEPDKDNDIVGGGWGAGSVRCVPELIFTWTSMDQISIKTPNPKCRLFLKI